MVEHLECYSKSFMFNFWLRHFKLCRLLNQLCDKSLFKYSKLLLYKKKKRGGEEERKRNETKS